MEGSDDARWFVRGSSRPVTQVDWGRQRCFLDHVLAHSDTWLRDHFPTTTRTQRFVPHNLATRTNQIVTVVVLDCLWSDDPISVWSYLRNLCRLSSVDVAIKVISDHETVRVSETIFGLIHVTGAVVHLLFDSLSKPC